MARDDEAQWLSDLSLRGSRWNDNDGIEAAIMRLSNHPELLHRFLNEAPESALMPAISPVDFDVFLEFDHSIAPVIRGVRQLSKTLAYHHPVSGDDRATSLQPLAFRPTNDDACLAIEVETMSVATDDSNASSGKPARVPRRLLVALIFAVVLVGLFGLA